MTPTPTALEGVRILDFTRLLPGPFCTMTLADMGAEVIKLEEPKQGDYLRWFPPYIGKESAQFLLLNRNKKSVKLNLRSPRAAEVFMRLAETADVVVDSFRPGVLDKAGCGYAAANERNPRIIYCAITGYGQTGPYRDWAGHDINYIGRAGILDITGRAGEKPVTPGMQTGDMCGGMMGVIGILGALAARERTGRGQFVDISMTDAAMSTLPLMAAQLFAGGAAPSRSEHALNGGEPFYDTYETADGRHVCIGAIEPKFWAKFCQLVGKPELEVAHFSGGKEKERLRETLESLFREKPRDEWMALLEGADVCVGPVLTIAEAFEDENAKAREMILEAPHPVLGALKQIGFPVKLSDTPCAITSPPPAFGEHTESILRGAGFTDEEIENLKKEKTI